MTAAAHPATIPASMDTHDSDSLFPFLEPRDFSPGAIIRVAFNAAVDNTFDYILSDSLAPISAGQRVEVPFGRRNKRTTAFCVETNIASPPLVQGRPLKLKRVLRKLDEEPLLNPELMELARWISRYYVCPIGIVLSAMLPAAVKQDIGTKTEFIIYLASAAPELVDSVKGAKQKAILAALIAAGADSQESAIESKDLLSQAGCTQVPLKHLIEKNLIRAVRRAVLPSLPVVPPAFVLEEAEVILNADQTAALDHIRRQLDTRSFGISLLHGVTDSGKTEVYIRAIEAVIAAGRSAIVLLPEIALTAQTVQRFAARFQRIAVMHSGLTSAQRNNEWRRIKAGLAEVVIGARSAIFAPLANLGLVVVDEEHEPSYKQDTAPRYSGRDVAIKRAQLACAHCILGSATPSLESLHNCTTRESFTVLRLPKRVNDLPMPDMKLIDLRETGQGGAFSHNLISDPLYRGLKDALARGEQAILLLNRRGYSSFIYCPSCRHTLHCRNCDVTLTFHRRKTPATDTIDGVPTVAGRHISGGYALCHYCLCQTLVPQKCPLCSGRMVHFGFGSQRLEEEVAARFPSAVVARVDSDSMRSADYYRVLKDFADRKIHILSGTQMLAKGLHFPNVTLVGIVSADTALSVPDFRANERTYQLITQVAGRAGRSEKKGVVFVQTFLPDQPVIDFAMRHDFEGFVKEEQKHRLACNLPPFWRLAVIHLGCEKYDRLATAADNIRNQIDAIVLEDALRVNVRGPMASVIDRIQRSHRMQIILEAQTSRAMQHLMDRLRVGGISPDPAVKAHADIDPINLL
ncbi:MAG TPA: primosomal protein N' [Sedimentisphaerales bacterium]|nr:primosomal protein N' [Sedimentisphaerales bacterium]